MKSKFLVGLTAGIATLVCALPLAACGGLDGSSVGTGGGNSSDPSDCQHSYGAYVSDGNATCEHDGTKTAYCNYCGIPDTVADAGSKLEHSFTYYSYDNNASCEHDGTKTAICDTCLTATDTVTDERHPRRNHTFTVYESDNNATCDHNGTKTANCDVCHNATDTIEDAGTAGHNYVNGSCTVCHASHLIYTVSGSAYSVAGVAEDCNDTEIIIPATENGKEIVNIGTEAFKGNTTITKLTLPESVTIITNNAFDGCTNLESITFAEGLTYIQSSAFANCTSLVNVTLPESLISLGAKVFADCTNLTTVNVGKNLRTFVSTTFDGCDKLESVNIAEANVYYHNVDGLICNSSKTIIEYVPKAISGDIAIPEKVTKIAGSNFPNRTNITSITIHKDVTEISAYSFNGCTALTDLYYEGTEEEWNAITKYTNWNSGADFTVHYNSVS